MTRENVARAQTRARRPRNVAGYRARPRRGWRDRFDLRLRQSAGRAAGVDVNALAVGFDDEGERLAEFPIVRPFGQRRHMRDGAGIRRLRAEDVIVGGGEDLDFPRADRAAVAGSDDGTLRAREAGGLHEIARRSGR